MVRSHKYMSFPDGTSVSVSDVTQEGVLVTFERCANPCFPFAKVVCNLPQGQWSNGLGFTLTESEYLLAFVGSNYSSLLQFAEIMTMTG